MSAKDSMSSNKAKQFFVLHGEKVAFGVCLLLVVVFFLLGRGVKSLEENKTPTALSNRVMSANQHMSSVNIERWRDEIEDARKPNFNLTPVVIEGRKTIDWNAYRGYLAESLPAPQALRGDPDLLPPSKPRVHGLFAALAVPPRTGLRESPLDLLDPAEMEKEEEKQKRKPKREDRSTDSYPGYGSSEGGYNPYSSEVSDDDEVLPMADSEGTKEYRVVTPNVYQRLPGFKGGNGIPEAYSIVVGTATVPVQGQWLEYRKKFEDAIGFAPMRDRPIYMWYQVDRQDVTDRPDGSIDPDAWTTIINYTKNYDDWYQPRYGAGPAPIVDPLYYEGSTGRNNDFALTSPIPYILLRDVEEFALHPDTPKRKPVVLDESSESEMTDPATGPTPEGPTPMGPSPTDPATGIGADPYASGASPYSPYASGSSSSASGSYSPSEGGYDGMEQSDFDPETGPAAPSKLLRFFDIKAKPGRNYRYRVRVALVDPNNPLDHGQSGADSGGSASYGEGGPSYGDGSASYSQPGTSSAAMGTGDLSSATVSLLWLEEEVRKRVEQVRQEDFDEHKIRFREWRFTDWSEPSDIVMVPERVEEVLAGSVVPPKQTRIDENVSFAKDEPTGTLAVSQWVPGLAVDVPAKKEVALGTVLNFTTKADVLHPIKLQIKRIPEFQFKTDAIVLDMRGGQKLPGSEEENVISAPGEFLVIDADGNLHAQNELEDLDEFRLKLLIPDEEEMEPEDSDYDSSYGESESTEDPGYYDSGSSRSRTPRSRTPRGSDDCS